MRARTIKVLFILTLCLSLLAIASACVKAPPSDATGVELTLKNWVQGLNDKSLTAVGATIYEVDSNEYSTFISQDSDTYFTSFTQPNYSTVNFDGYTEVGASAMFSKWTVSLEIKYTVTRINSDGTTSDLSGKDVFENSYYFIKHGDNWYFASAPSPFEGNVPCEGFTLDDGELPQAAVTFDSNGGSAVAQQTVTVGDSAVEPVSPTRAGYAFSGWYTGNDLKTKWTFSQSVQSSFALFAGWNKNDGSAVCTLSTVGGIIGSDAINESNRTVSATLHFTDTTYDTALITAATGATVGVYSDRSGSTRLPASIPLEVGNNQFYIIVLAENGSATRTYTAVFKRLAQYTVSYKETADATTVLAPSVLVEENAYITPPTAAEVTKTGHSLEGWRKDGNAFNAAVTPITADTILTPIWGAKTNVLTLDGNGGTVSTASVTVTYKQNYNLGKATRRGYTFNGWALAGIVVTDADGKSLAVWDGQKDESLAARWQTTTYNVSYRLLQDGINHADNPTTFNINTNFTLGSPTRTGYTFDGWFLTVTGNTFSDQITAVAAGTYSQDLQVFAKWTPKDYQIVFDTNGADSAAPTTQSVSFAETVSEPTIPTKSGQSFIGWYKDSTFTTPWDFESSPSGDAETITLYARWTEQFTDGLTFTKKSNGTYAVQEYTGSATSGIIVPATYLGAAVTAIGDGAFRNSQIVSLSLPSSIIKISVNSFFGCDKLTTLTMNGVSEIATAALNGTAQLTTLSIADYYGELGALFGTATYTDSYTAIGASGTRYQIPATLTEVTYTAIAANAIAPYAFAGFTALTDINLTISDGDGSNFAIREYAFYDCTLLDTVAFSGNSNRIKSIGTYAFAKDVALSQLGTTTNTVTLPSAVTAIGRYAFQGVSAPIALNSALTAIPEYAFAGYKGNSVLNVTAVSSIGAHAFEFATALKQFGSTANVVDLSAVTAVDPYAFYTCRGLTAVTLPTAETYDEIAEGTFDSCTLLAAITLPNNVKAIATRAFQFCAGLTSINLNLVANVFASAFYNCATLATVSSALPSSATLAVDAYAFAACHADLTSIAMTNGATLSANTLWRG